MQIFNPLTFILSAVVVLIIAIEISRFLPRYYYMKKVSEKPFICPWCGHTFHVKWYRLLIKYITVDAMGTALFKCPNCKKTDQCTWSGKRD